MSGGRPANRGSFGTHLDELVKHFPHEASAVAAKRSAALDAAQQEKRDIHAMLFEQAWRLDDDNKNGRTR